jgi:hypothetical protein
METNTAKRNVLLLPRTARHVFIVVQDLFHWSPEYDRGGAEYEKAATIYKNHKEWAKAIYAYEKCAEANDKASLPTKVASALDFKAGCHRDAGQVIFSFLKTFLRIIAVFLRVTMCQLAEAVQGYKAASNAYMRKPVSKMIGQLECACVVASLCNLVKGYLLLNGEGGNIFLNPLVPLQMHLR